MVVFLRAQRNRTLPTLWSYVPYSEKVMRIVTWDRWIELMLIDICPIENCGLWCLVEEDCCSLYASKFGKNDVVGDGGASKKSVTVCAFWGQPAGARSSVDRLSLLILEAFQFSPPRIFTSNQVLILLNLSHSVLPLVLCSSTLFSDFKFRWNSIAQNQI